MAELSVERFGIKEGRQISWKCFALESTQWAPRHTRPTREESRVLVTPGPLLSHDPVMARAPGCHQLPVSAMPSSGEGVVHHLGREETGSCFCAASWGWLLKLGSGGAGLTQVGELLRLTSIESVMPPAISSSVVPFSSCPQSLPASESFPMSQLFA